MKRLLLAIWLLAVWIAFAPGPFSAPAYGATSEDIGEAGGEAGEGMNNARLDQLIRQIEGIEGDIEGQAGAWRFAFEGFQVYILTDETADRMRIMVPIIEIKDLDQAALLRLMQANFDSALDARYAITQEVLWSAFLHPLATLAEEEFSAGFVQTVTLAATYGTSYSSGALKFRGGDSPAK
jgi:hypothetical protein